METQKPNKFSLLMARSALLLALPVIFGAVVSTATVSTATVLEPAELSTATLMQPAQLQSPPHVLRGIAVSQPESVRLTNTIERVSTGQSDGWVTASPDIYQRIALAFGTEAMEGAELNRVECRSSLCRVAYQADQTMQVRRVLPRQLAETFNSVVTVHSGAKSGAEHLVYLDIPVRG